VKNISMVDCGYTVKHLKSQSFSALAAETKQKGP
jgi:hypothetical protein